MRGTVPVRGDATIYLLTFINFFINFYYLLTELFNNFNPLKPLFPEVRGPVPVRGDAAAGGRPLPGCCPGAPHCGAPPARGLHGPAHQRHKCRRRLPATQVHRGKDWRQKAHRISRRLL